MKFDRRQTQHRSKRGKRFKSSRRVNDNTSGDRLDGSAVSDPPAQPQRRGSVAAGQDSPHRHSVQTDPFDLSTSADAKPQLEAESLDGIHPSRRRLFNVTQRQRDPSMAAAAIMAPPPPTHEHKNQHPQHHQSSQQQRSNHNGLGINGLHPQDQPEQRSQSHDKDSRSRHANVPPLTPTGPRPMSSHIQVAKPYVFQQAIEGCLKDIGVAQAREDNIRLAGVQWIDNTRRALKLPVRTFDTAVVYFHKFRLVHSDGEYSFVDAAAAALFAACKIEDTLKKSRDILCTAHNLKIQNRAEHLSPDDSTFEQQSRTIIGLERLMLESSSFDFRTRHPQHLLVKLAKFYAIPRSSPIIKTAYNISIDLYRTFAPLKHCTATLAFASLELAGRLLKEADNYPGLRDVLDGRDYARWSITRGEVMETLLDLLELYTHYRTSSLIGPSFALDAFLEVRIPLNQELSNRNLPRFTEYIDPGRISGRADTGSYAATVNGVSAANIAANGTGRGTASPTSPANKAAQNGIRQKAGERGREGTVRSMLNPDRERQERAVVAEYGPPHGQVPSGPATTGSGGGGGGGGGGSASAGAAVTGPSGPRSHTQAGQTRR